MVTMAIIILDHREGEFFWGKDSCCLIQLKPEFKKIVCKPVMKVYLSNVTTLLLVMKAVPS